MVMTSAQAVGTDTIEADYSGDTNFTTSSNTLQQTVNQASSSTTLTSSDNPSVFGQTVTFTATVAAVSPGSGTPTGSVTFLDTTTGATLGVINLDSNGQATVMTSAQAVGTDTIEADYSGDTNFTASSNTLQQTVNQASSSTALTSSANPSVFGQTVTFTATVTAVAPGSGTPTGTVTFLDTTTGTTLGVINLDSNGQATVMTSAQAVGTDTIEADYSGDTNFTASSNTLMQMVNKADTSTGIMSSENPSIFGDPVTFTATVSAVAPGAGTPTGMLIFVDQSNNNTVLQTLALDANGQASFTISTLSVGTHTIAAEYQGDDGFTASTGTMDQVVNRPII
jgi:hypothetical protein